MEPPQTKYPSELACALDALVVRRRQLSDNIVDEKNRLEHSDPSTNIFINDHIEFLEDQIAEIDTELSKLTKNDERLNNLYQLLRSMKGVGPVLAYTIIAQLPEIGTYTKGAIASLVGVAPHTNDSGRYRGKRSIFGGRRNLRKVLYMAALSSLREPGHLKSLYTRLVVKGKPKKVAIVAVMRKMLVTLNAMVRTSTNWDRLQNSVEPA